MPTVPDDPAAARESLGAEIIDTMEADARSSAEWARVIAAALRRFGYQAHVAP